jgi:hypothetical protein
MADGRTDRITAQDDNYESSKAGPEPAIPDGTKLNSIRTNS